MIKTEQVYHPKHYNKVGRTECWDEMVDISPIGTMLFDLWNAYKYQYRAGDKSGNDYDQDMTKADNYKKHAEMIHSETEVSSEVEEIYQRMLKNLL